MKFVWHKSGNFLFYDLKIYKANDMLFYIYNMYYNVYSLNVNYFNYTNK